MAEKRIKIVGLPSIWLVAWIFTIGYADLGFWQGALAFFIWPYHIGRIVAGF